MVFVCLFNKNSNDVAFGCIPCSAAKATQCSCFHENGLYLNFGGFGWSFLLVSSNCWSTPSEDNHCLFLFSVSKLFVELSDKIVDPERIFPYLGLGV